MSNYKGNFVLRKSVDFGSKKKKRQSDMRLNNPDVLSCSCHF